MGGSSAINGQIAIRPPLEDFDIWAREGCRGWSAAEVLPAFMKLETMRPLETGLSWLRWADSDLSGSCE